jgi:alpha-1,6-mannosyltransferase
LGHKEVRFLFPVLPLFNIGAAAGLSRIHGILAGYRAKDKPASGPARLLYAGGIAALLLSLAASLAFVEVSRRNYPGGRALEALARHVRRQQGRIAEVRVRVDVAAAMTGASKFAEREARLRAPRAAWAFSKAGYEEEHAILGDMSGFTHILSETPHVRGFHVLEAIPGNPRLDPTRLRIETSDAIYVLENDELR